MKHHKLVYGLALLALILVLLKLSTHAGSVPAYAATAQPTVAATAADIFSSNSQISFTADVNRKKTVHFVPGTEASIELTDAKGFKWTLSLPAYALTIPMDISLSPVTKATLKDAKKNPILSGIQFEPDGLVFSNPATLTVTSKQKKPIRLLTSHQDGTSVQPAIPVNDDPSAVYVTHFSADFAKDFSDPGEARISYENALKLAKDYLESQNGTPLTYPKDIPTFIASCDHPKTDAEFDLAYDLSYSGFAEPESTLLYGIIANAKHLPADQREAALHNEKDTLDTLANRILQKIILAIKDAQKEPDYGEAKSPALIAMLLRTQRNLEFLASLQDEKRGVTVDDTEVLKVIASWLKNIVVDDIQHLANDHDYEKVSHILFLQRELALSNRDSTWQEGDELLQKLHDALRFKMHFESTLTAQGGFSESFVGDIDISHDLNPVILLGQGDIPYTSGQLNNANSAGSVVGTYRTGKLLDKSFPVTIKVYTVDPCVGFIFGADQFGSPTESWSLTAVNGKTYAGPVPLYYKVFNHDFQTNGGLRFVLPMQNKNVEAAKATMTRSTANYTVVFSVTVIHTPKK